MDSVAEARSHSRLPHFRVETTSFIPAAIDHARNQSLSHMIEAEYGIRTEAITESAP
jgi:hypothetical protein